MLLVWLVLPVGLLFLVTWIHGPSTTTRNLIFILPAFLMITANGIVKFSAYITMRITEKSRMKMPNRIAKNFILIGVLVIFLLSSINPIVLQFSKEKADWRGTGQFLDGHVKDGDLIVLIRDPADYLRFYYTGTVKVISIPDNYYWFSGIPMNYSKIWIVPSPDFGIHDQLLKKWITDNCKAENESYGIFSFSNVSFF